MIPMPETIAELKPAMAQQMAQAATASRLLTTTHMTGATLPVPLDIIGFFDLKGVRVLAGQRTGHGNVEMVADQDVGKRVDGYEMWDVAIEVAVGRNKECWSVLVARPTRPGLSIRAARYDNE
jgi:hypothetical protein